MARPGTPQTSFNSGELGPNFGGRTDVKQYYAGASLMLNAEPIPQGGFRLSPRSRRLGRVRRPYVTRGPGTRTNALGPHTVAATLVLIDLGAPQAIAAVDLAAFSATLARAACLEVQYLDPSDATWKPLAPAFSVDTVARARRAARPPGAPVTTQKIRLQLTVGGAAITFAIGAVSLYGEDVTLAPAWRLVPFTYSKTEAYDLVLTPFNVDVWRNGAFVGACASPLAGDQVRAAGIEQRFDTLLFFHEDVAPGKIMRRGGDHEWAFEDPGFTKIPQVDYGGSYSKVTDVWELYLKWGTAGPVGLGVSLTIDGEDTPAKTIQAGPDWALLQADLAAAVAALEGVEPGFVLSIVADSNRATISITFSGAGNLGERFVVSGRVVNGDGAITAANVQKGDRGGEDLMSPTRGYPTCARFYQDRLVLGGYRSKPGAFLASVTGEYYNQNIEIAQGDGAILLNLDTDGAEQIIHLERGRHLLIFTTAAHYYIADRAVTRGQPVNIVHSESNGAAAAVPIVRQGDALLYVSENRSLLYRAAYNDVSQAYESEPLSLLASHLVEGIVGAAIQRPAKATDAARYFAVRDDGLMVIGILIPNQEVVAFTRWLTDGSVRDVSVNGANEAHMLVERAVGTGTELFLERLELGLLFDCCVTGTPAGAVVTGLADHEGRQVWADADGYVLGPYTVSDGQITLPIAATSVVVGRWTPPRVRSMPANREVAERVVVKKPTRVHTVRVNVIDTTSLAIGANGERAQADPDGEIAIAVEDCPLYEGGMVVDAPQPGVTREVVKDGLLGWTVEGLAEISQVRPGRFTVRDITVEREG